MRWLPLYAVGALTIVRANQNNDEPGAGNVIAV
jgi:hypothetical protein